MAKEPARLRRDIQRVDEDAVDSLFDVPAAVVCAFCGEPDCPGCIPSDDLGSGVVAIVPWERSDGAAWRRLWATANATTQGADAFFAALPDGEVSPALRFAVLAELLAVGSMAIVVIPFVALALPNLALQILSSPELRWSAVRWLALGVPLLAAWMVVAHATHGIALDVGAARNGARSQRRRALRFGLYACGWDLMTMPIGALVTLVKGGARAASDLIGLSMRVPAVASTALLEGVYGLGPAQAALARRAGTVAAVLAAFLVGLGVVALLVLVLLR